MTNTAQVDTSQQVEYKQGDFCHLEMPVTDLVRAKRFYGEAFGWTFHDVPEMNYTLFFTPGGKLGGGLFEPSEMQPSQVVNYLAVDSIEATAKQIEALGGKAVSPKIEIPGHGHFMHVLDSEGSLIAIWQS